MNFHETQMGQQFFYHQFPKLIRTLQEIATALSREPVVIKIKTTANTDILHELYSGNYEPEPFGDRECSVPQDQQVMQAETALRTALPPAAEELLEAYQIAVSARDSAAAEQAYKSGFRLAVQLILEGRISYLTPGKEDICE